MVAVGLHQPELVSSGVSCSLRRQEFLVVTFLQEHVGDCKSTYLCAPQLPHTNHLVVVVASNGTSTARGSAEGSAGPFGSIALRPLCTEPFSVSEGSVKHLQYTTAQVKTE